MTERCAHFGACGGCSFQDMPRDEYLEMKYQGVCSAIARQNLDSSSVTRPLMAPAASRRRTTMALSLDEGVARTGFHAARSHDVVDLNECLVLTPPLVCLVRSFRRIVPLLLKNGERAELRMIETDHGADFGLYLPRPAGAAVCRTLSNWATGERVARVTVNGQLVFQLDAPSVTVAKVPVALPPGAFLQPTEEGERFLQDCVREAVADARRVVDLFAGCGTFSFAVARKASVHAVDADAAALAALDSAARKASGLKPLTIETRNLFKRPLQTNELDRFAAAVLDPPRAGAHAQAKVLAASRLRRIGYVSCNPESFARDARALVDGGYAIAWVRPVDQFLWSSHIELAALFERRQIGNRN